MSTHESKRNSSQARPQSNKPGNSTQSQAPHKPGNRRPLPFDDDDTEDQGGGVVKQTNPNVEIKG